MLSITGIVWLNRHLFTVSMCRTLVIIVVVTLAQTTLASRPCCPNGNNTLIMRRCADGSAISAVSCPHRYVTNRSSATLDEEQNLEIAGSKIPPHRYCATSLKNRDVYMVCFDHDTSTTVIFTTYAVLELVSVFFILVTIVVYLQVRDLLDLQSVCILHSISGLALSFVALATNQLMTRRLEQTLCIFLAYAIYFTMLYSFFWLHVLAFHIFRTIVNPFPKLTTRRWPLVYYLFGCGGPLLFLVILVIAHSMQDSDNHPGFGKTKCWFQSTKTQFIYFYAPMAVLLCFNVAYYACTVATMWRAMGQNDEKKNKVTKYRFWLCVKLFFIMGMSWIFELLSAAFQDVGPVLRVVWHVTDGLNTIQGILIFLILVVCRKRVLRSLADRNLCGVRLPGQWRALADDECNDIEEELNLSETQAPKQHT